MAQREQGLAYPTGLSGANVGAALHWKTPLAGLMIRASDTRNNRLDNTVTAGNGAASGLQIIAGTANEEFLQAYIGKNDTAYPAGWRSLVFSGQATMPKSLDGDTAIVEFVAHNAGTVGYIGKASPHEGVKVLSVK